MATLSDYFETEARDCLAQIDRTLDRGPVPDAAELHRAARMLRGSAQLAREERVFRAASAFEATTRALTTSDLAWNADIAQRARATVADLRTLLVRTEDAALLDARAAESVARWHEIGLGVAAPARDRSSGGLAEFRGFAAREAAGVADALERGIQQLTQSPMDREPLKGVLRRQRALLGAARLDEIPVVAEVLRAIEDLTRVIAKLDVGVKQEWLDIYRVAREALRAAIGPLEQDEDPPSSHALSRLRHMRAELLERYGGDDAGGRPADGLFRDATAQEPGAAAVAAAAAGEPGTEAETVPSADVLVLDDEAEPDTEVLVLDDEVKAPTEELVLEEEAAPVTDELVLDEEAASPSDELLLEHESTPGTAAAAAAFPAPEETVAIDELCYTRDGALRRALELRDIILRATDGDTTAGEAAEEVFDLIQIALD